MQATAPGYDGRRHTAVDGTRQMAEREMERERQKHVQQCFGGEVKWGEAKWEH